MCRLPAPTHCCVPLSGEHGWKAAVLTRPPIRGPINRFHLHGHWIFIEKISHCIQTIILTLHKSNMARRKFTFFVVAVPMKLQLGWDFCIAMVGYQGYLISGIASICHKPNTCILCKWIYCTLVLNRIVFHLPHQDLYYGITCSYLFIYIYICKYVYIYV